MEIKLKYKYSYIGNSITNVDMVVKQCEFPYQRVRFNVLSTLKENLNTVEMLKLLNGGEEKMLEILKNKINDEAKNQKGKLKDVDISSQLLKVQATHVISKDLWRVLKG